MLLTILFLLTSYQSAQAQTALGKTAASMAPGTWAQLTGTNAGLLSTQWGNGHGYDDGSMGWDSTAKKLYHTSANHGVNISNSSYLCDQDPTTGGDAWYTTGGTCWKPLSYYDDAKDTWSIGALRSNEQPPHVHGGHSMDQFAWDDVNKIVYIQEYYTGNFYRYCVNNTPNWCNGRQGTWTLFTLPGQPITQSAQGLAYFPGMNGGTLLFFWGDGSGFGTQHGVLYGYKESNTIGGTGTWTILAGSKGELTNGDYNVMAECSPVKNVCIFGGGTGNATGTNAKHVYKIDASGTITQMPNSPWDIGFAAVDTRTLLADPVSGDFISLFGHSNDSGTTTTSAELWRLNPNGAGAWTLLESGLQAFGKPCGGPAPTYNKPCPNDFFGTAVSTYGVLLYWRFTGPSDAEVWLYKVSATSSDITPPTVSITAPTAGATISGASVTLSATAADNVGVSGVQFKVDGNSVGVEDSSSPYSISWDSTTGGNGTHLITAFARDAAGNTTTSASVSVTVSNAVAGSDFTTRCTAPGVLRCVGFDNASDIVNSLWGANSGLSTDGTAQGVLDSSIKASGNSSLKLTIPISSGPNNSGNYWLNFSDDLRTVFPCHGESYAGTTCVQAGTGNDYYVQFRARFDPYYITHAYSGGGWKLAWIGNVGDHPGCTTGNTTNCFASCTELEQVLQNTFHYNVGVLGYYGCPGVPYEANYYVDNLPSPGDTNFQSGMPSPYCLYSTFLNCFRWFPNEWMTFQTHLHVDSPRTFTGVGGGADCGAGLLCRDYPNSYIEVWVAREGQPSQLVITKPFPISAGTNAQDLRYGKIWLTAYESGRVPGGADATQESYVWFDEVIISTVRINDPSLGGIPPVPVVLKIPSSATGLKLGGAGAKLGSQATQ